MADAVRREAVSAALAMLDSPPQDAPDADPLMAPAVAPQAAPEKR
jgi:hypothetical protein